MTVVVQDTSGSASEVASVVPPILKLRLGIRAEGLSAGQSASVLDTRLFMRLQRDHQTLDIGPTEFDVTDNGAVLSSDQTVKPIAVLVRIAPEAAKWIARNIKTEYFDLSVTGSALCLVEPEHGLHWEPIRGENREAAFALRIPVSSLPKLSRPRSPRVNRSRPTVDPFAVLKEHGEQGLRNRLNGESLEALRAIVRSFVLDPSRRSHKWVNRDKLIDLIVSRVASESERGKVFL
jgi:hypothetical protein